MKTFSVLLVDNEIIDRMLIMRSLKSANISVNVTEAENCAEGLLYLHSNTFDCVLINDLLPDGTAQDFYKKLSLARLKQPIVLMAGEKSETVVINLMDAGASCYLHKNYVTPEILAHTLSTALRLYEVETRRQDAIEALRSSNETIQQSKKRLDITRKQILHSENMASIGQSAIWPYIQSITR